MVLLEAYLKQPVSFAQIQQEKKATDHSLTLAVWNKLKLIRDYNRGLQKLGNGPEKPNPPTPAENDGPLLALLRVFTHGIVDERIRQAAQIIVDDTLTVHDKLTQIDELIPFPPTALAEQLGEMLGVTRQAVMKTVWWRQNRRGRIAEKIERRRSRMKERGREYERQREEEDSEEER